MAIEQNQKTAPEVGVPPKRYDKGERRYKHVGRSASAAVDLGNPKKVVGKCPNNIPQALRVKLLQTAISAKPIDPELGYAKHLYLTYQGIIYECATSDFGLTYHAYPYHGVMRRSLLNALRGSIDATLNPVAFGQWEQAHIEVRG